MFLQARVARTRVYTQSLTEVYVWRLTSATRLIPSSACGLARGKTFPCNGPKYHFRLNKCVLQVTTFKTELARKNIIVYESTFPSNHPSRFDNAFICSMHSFYYIDTDHVCRRINNERSKQHRMTKIGKAIHKDDIDMVDKWNDKYGAFMPDKVLSPSTAWFDPSLLRSAPSSE